LILSSLFRVFVLSVEYRLSFALYSLTLNDTLLIRHEGTSK
uniref:Ovule protein n=1 Tax=Haemonchus placei TaxID=6290 RepID=A0A0N4WTA2_HAEPC